MDVAGQIEYWKTGSEEDIAAAESLLEKGHSRHSLFFAHLSVEKMLKALVTRETGKIPPRIHNLVRLAQAAGLALTPERERTLRRFDMHQMEGRYPDSGQTGLNHEVAVRELQMAVEVLQWLRAQLPTS